MPTVLPTARVAPAKKGSLLRIVFDLVFNTAFVVGALVLTFVVLVRDERYARGAAYAPPLPIQQPVQSPEAGEPKSILSSYCKRVLAVLRPANPALTSTRGPKPRLSSVALKV